MRLPFYTLDVFTDRPFGGNPLGVFPDAAHLPTALMQRIAREMNLSETVFLGPPETPRGTARVRIFTPAVEIPFAGHPTEGAALFLAGRLGTTEERAGETRVLLEDGRPVFGRLTTAQLSEHRPATHTPAALAAMVGLEAADVCPEGFPAEMVSCGLPYYIVPIRSVDAVRRAALDLSLWRKMLADTWAHHVYLVAMDAEGEEADVRVRMFAPGSGVPEDPATGSAAVALGGYLAARSGTDQGTLSWVAEQGLEVGRPSLLYIEADRARGVTTAIRVGGRAIQVLEGTMQLPD